jgi:hypothetical protein
MPSSLTKSSERYRPGKPDPAVDSRKAQFDAMNKFITERGGWVTSIPGATMVSFEVLPPNSLPEELRAARYDVEKDGGDKDGGDNESCPWAVVEKVFAGESQVRALPPLPAKSFAGQALVFPRRPTLTFGRFGST